jgi:dihydrofolate reductase
MRKIIVLSFITLDNVMQAPGGPEEDTSGNFKYGGWSVNYFEDFMFGVMGEQMGHDYDLLLGRKTYDIFAAYWPNSKDPGAEGLNKAHKYVVSTTLTESKWDKSTIISKDVAEEIRKLKATDGPELQVHGSSVLIQTLLKNDLVDELWLKIHPLTLGEGKKLFGEGTIPAGFELTLCKSSPKGVIVANYKRAGEVTTGTF